MGDQAAGLDEAFPTFRALVGPLLIPLFIGSLSIMLLLVVPQLGGKPEAFPTFLTLMRLLARVRFYVVVEVDSLNEGFLTYVAFIGPVAIVGLQVSLEVGGAGEAFSADVTHVGPLPAVDVHMLRQMRGPHKAFPTLLAVVWLLWDVRSIMYFEFETLAEAFPTSVTEMDPIFRPSSNGLALVGSFSGDILSFIWILARGGCAGITNVCRTLRFRPTILTLGSVGGGVIVGR